MSDAETRAYTVEQRGDGWLVIAPGGSTLLECRDEHSARHYEELLNRAYRAGYRSGYRDGRAK